MRTRIRLLMAIAVVVSTGITAAVATGARVQAGDARGQRFPESSGYHADLQVMPWPVYGKMSDRELEAIYEFLRAIPMIQPAAGFLPTSIHAVAVGVYPCSGSAIPDTRSTKRSARGNTRLPTMTRGQREHFDTGRVGSGMEHAPADRGATRPAVYGGRR